MNTRPVIDRFLARVAKPEGEGCWEWKGGKDQAGYGHMVVDGKNVVAHRVAYTLFRGEIPGRLYVCHSCDNPTCVNPGHLWLGTSSDNQKDSIAKGRRPVAVAPKQASRAVRFPMTETRGEAIKTEITANPLMDRAVICKSYGVTLRTYQRWIADQRNKEQKHNE